MFHKTDVIGKTYHDHHVHTEIRITDKLLDTQHPNHEFRVEIGHCMATETTFYAIPSHPDKWNEWEMIHYCGGKFDDADTLADQIISIIRPLLRMGSKA
jgi:hypothetical protein